MAEPFVKLYKKMIDWEWYDDANTMRLFIHCLLKANWKEGSWHGISYKPGQFITSLSSLAEETGLSIKQVRTSLNHLKETNEVTDLRQGNCRIITVVKWDEYQCEGKPRGRQGANQGQTKGKLGAADKEYKEYKELKEYKYSPDSKIEKAFSEFVEMRKKIRKPMSDRAVELSMERLTKLSRGDSDLAVQIINQSIMHSYQGLFPLKDEPKQNPKVHNFTERDYNFAELEQIALGERK